MSATNDGGANDFFRGSDFYAVGFWSGAEGRQHQPFIAMVPLSRYKEAEPMKHCHVDTVSRVPWLVSVPKGGERMTEAERARRAEATRLRWAANRIAAG